MPDIYDTTVTFKNGAVTTIRERKPIQSRRALHIKPEHSGATVLVPLVWGKEARFNKVEATDAA